MTKFYASTAVVMVKNKITLKRLIRWVYKHQWLKTEKYGINKYNSWQKYFFSELEHRILNSKIMGKRQERSICGNTWIDFSAVSFIFIGWIVSWKGLTKGIISSEECIYSAVLQEKVLIPLSLLTLKSENWHMSIIACKATHCNNPQITQCTLEILISDSFSLQTK